MKKIFSAIANAKARFFSLSYRRRCIFLLLFFNVSLLIVSIVYGLHVNASLESGVDAVRCGFKETIGLYCPGCGGSRSLLALLKLDLRTSFLSYPPLIPIVLILAYHDLVALLSAIKNKPEILKKYTSVPMLISIPAMIIAFFFIRNILLFYGIDYLGDVLHS